MKIKQKIVALILTTIFFLTCVPISFANATSYIDGGSRGIFLDIFEYADSAADGASVEYLTSKIDRTVEFMKENNMNTLYFKTMNAGISSYNSETLNNLVGENVSVQGTEDLLEYAIKQSHGTAIKVVAWVNPWNLPEDYSGKYSIKYAEKQYLNIAVPEGREQSITEIENIIKTYDVDVVLDTNFYPSPDFDDKQYFKKSSDHKTIDQFRTDNISSYMEELSEVKQNHMIGAITDVESYSLGLSGNTSRNNYSDVPTWIKNDWVDFIMPVLDMEMNAVSEKNDYMYYADKWKNLHDISGVDWIPILSSSKLVNNEYKDKSELSLQMFYAQASSASGIAFDSGELFISNSDKHAQSISQITDFFYDGDEPTSTINMGFELTRPSKDITVNGEYYYMMGISDPSVELYCNDEDVDFRGNKGTFGHYVMLDEGANVYEFYQPGLGTKSVTITYEPQTDEVAKTISKITQSTMDPMVQDIAYVGESYTLECIAPAGGEVTAQVLGTTVVLEQVEKSADKGIAAVYRGEYTVPNVLETNYVKMIGKVTYNLNFDGTYSTYESNGDLYIAYHDSKIKVKAKEFMTTVYETASINYDYTSVMNIGTEAVIDGQTTQMFGLANGGYVKKSDVDILYNVNTPDNKVSDVRFETAYNSEKLVFEGAKNSAYKINSDGNITVDLYNVKGSWEEYNGFDILKKHSKLFSDVKVSSDSNSVKMEFVLKPGKEIWGYSLDYDGDNSILYFAKKPSLSGDKSKPLNGITVVLDAGHGGDDPGAMGPPADFGPIEKDATLLTAIQTRQNLESMGATVLMTRTADYSMDLYERAAITEKVKPDFFISIHLNSVLEISNGGKAEGVEIYYANDTSYQLGEEILGSISGSTGRKAREVNHGVYVVARPTSSPAVLCEIGFMPNPQEYENMIDPTITEHTGHAIAKAVEAVLK